MNKLIDNLLLPDISVIIIDYLGKHKIDYDLRYLIENDLVILFEEGKDCIPEKCDRRTANACIKFKQFYILDCLMKIGIECDDRALRFAIENQDLQSIKFLESKGIKCNKYYAYVSVIVGNLDIIKIFEEI
jgi:hypothetical protein